MSTTKAAGLSFSLSLWGVMLFARASLLALAVAMHAQACAAPPELTPKTGPGTGYPCGVNGVQCIGDMCCWQNETCGGAFPSVGCPPGMCCFIGESPGDLGASAPHPQTPATVSR